MDIDYIRHPQSTFNSPYCGRFFFIKNSKDYVIARTKQTNGQWEIWKHTPDSVLGSRWCRNMYTLIETFPKLRSAIVALKLLEATK